MNLEKEKNLTDYLKREVINNNEELSEDQKELVQIIEDEIKHTLVHDSANVVNNIIIGFVPFSVYKKILGCRGDFKVRKQTVLREKKIKYLYYHNTFNYNNAPKLITEDYKLNKYQYIYSEPYVARNWKKYPCKLKIKFAKKIDVKCFINKIEFIYNVIRQYLKINIKYTCLSKLSTEKEFGL